MKYNFCFQYYDLHCFTFYCLIRTKEFFPLRILAYKSLSSLDRDICIVLFTRPIFYFFSWIPYKYFSILEVLLGNRLVVQFCYFLIVERQMWKWKENKLYHASIERIINSSKKKKKCFVLGLNGIRILLPSV